MSFPAYPKYRDSGVQGLGKVPVEWEVTAFKRLVDIQNGADHKHIQEEEGYPVYGSGGAFTFASAYLFNGEAILLGRKGTIDKPLYVNEAFWAVDTMFWSKVQSGVSGRFAYYVALNIPFWYYATGTALPSMTQGALGGHVVAVPPLAEQRAIAAFLDQKTARIDAAVAAQRHLIGLAAEKGQVITCQVVTRGLDSSVPIKASEVDWISEFPAHWQVTRVANLFKEINVSSDDERPILSVSIHDGVSDDELSEAESGRKVSRSEDRSKYKAVEPGDLVYNMMRAWQGGFGAVTVSGAVSPAYVVARPHSPQLAEYIELVLRTPNAIAEMKRHSRGITDFRMRLYWDEFKNIEVPVPPEDEISAILQRVRDIKSETARVADAASRMNALLQQRRSALISAAVTGKIDVRGNKHHTAKEAA